MLRIGVDAMGGDFAPVQVILGAAEAVQQLSGLATIVLLGDADKITGICRENGIPYSVWNYLSTPNDGNRFSLVDDDNRQILSEELKNILLGNF